MPAVRSRPAAVGRSLYSVNANGSPDATFGGGGGHVFAPTGISDLAVRPDGKIVGSGTSGSQVATTNMAAFQLFPGGVPDSNFGTNGLYNFDTGQ